MSRIQMFLVFKFMENGSLEDRLFRTVNSQPLFFFRKRFEIAAEFAATPLSFFHQAKPEPLVHRDLKPAKTMWASKINDVGLAR